MKQNAGFTLIELIVALAILSVIGVAIGMMTVTGIKASNQALKLSTERNEAMLAILNIKKEVQFARSAELRNDTAGGSEAYLYVDGNGHIVTERGGVVTDLFDQSSMDGKTGYSMTFRAGEDSLLTVELTVFDREKTGQNYSLPTSFQLVNVPAAQWDAAAQGAYLGYGGTGSA